MCDHMALLSTFGKAMVLSMGLLDLEKIDSAA
jgi:hypothetical protein